jgi:glucan phosphoethanolaminetransferase (alkaline phosphatase superfamily)
MIRKDLMSLDDPRYDEIENAFLDFVKITFGLFFILYSLLFPLLLLSLKKTFPDLYRKDHLRISIASLFIIFSLAARFIFIFVWRMDGVYRALNESFLAGTWFYPVFLFSFDICTIICPLASMIFSLIYLMDKEREQQQIAATSDNSDANLISINDIDESLF